VFKIPRGTRDFTPDEMEKRSYIEECMKSTFKTFGYREIKTPMFETLELFTAKSGETIIDEIYSFTDKGGRELALRPELTAPVMRLYVDKLQMEPKPLKLFYFGNCFRYDRPQKGRYREFRQAGCELIGTNTPEGYAELIALAYTLLKNVGLKHITLKIGNLTILSSLFKLWKIPKEQQKQLLPLIDKNQFDDVSSLLNEIGIGPDESNHFVKILQTTDEKKIYELIQKDNAAANELRTLEKILDLLKNAFTLSNYHIDLGIVRGLDYYKGIVFEIDAPVLGAEKQLCGGGAYELVPLFGGTDIPTSGFAIGFDRTILALEAEHFTFPHPKTDAYIIPVNEALIQTSLVIAQELRRNGVLTDVDLLQRGVGKALRYADALHAKKAIVVGPNEVENNSVTIRDMKTGEQKVVKIKEIYTKIKTK